MVTLTARFGFCTVLYIFITPLHLFLHGMPCLHGTGVCADCVVRDGTVGLCSVTPHGTARKSYANKGTLITLVSCGRLFVLNLVMFILHTAPHLVTKSFTDVVQGMELGN